MKQLLFGCLALSACSVYEENLGRTRDASARWAITVGTRQQDVARAVATDSLGDVVAVGCQQENSEQNSGFITKRVASDGSERWTTKFRPLTRGSQADTLAVAIAPLDAVLAAGSFQGRVDFAGTTLDASNPTPTDGSAAFVAMLSSTGRVAWVTMLQNVYVQAIAVDHDGRFYVTGAFLGPLTIAGVTLSSSAAGKGAVLIALDATGVPLWGRTFVTSQASAGNALGDGLTIAPNGDVLVAGRFAGAYEFGGAVLQVPAGKRQASFLTRFRSDGLYLASSVVPQPREVEGHTRVALDPAGATVIYNVTDSVSETVEPPAVHVLDDAQNQLWSASVHGPIAFASDGALFTAQWIDRRTTGTGGALELATVDASGFTWSTSLGMRIGSASGYSGLRAAAAAPDGGVALVGHLTGAIRIADVDLRVAGGQVDTDALVIMVDP
jgi:hypothetical protein